jgi:hypothetical protein
MKPQSFWNRKIPSLFGIVVLIAGVVVTGWMAQTGIIFTGRAAPGNTPNDITVTNITDTSFTVTYTTTDTVLGSVAYSEGSGNEAIAFDDRDQKSGQPSPQRAHSITIRNAKAGAKYVYSINSGGGSFTDNGKKFTVTTGKKLSGNPPANKPVKGKVVTSDGSPALNSLVYLAGDNSQILSAITQPDGTYTIPTAPLRKKDLTSYAVLSPTTKLTIGVVSPDGTSSVTVLAKSTNPVPLITLSNSYDFATSIDSPTRISSESAEITGFPQVGEEGNTTAANSVKITTPKDGQALSDQRPTFKGSAPPNAEVEITIDSDDPIQANVMSDRRGNWTYRPKSPIAPGESSVTVNARDGSGIVKNATQSFTVLASGSQFTDPSVSPAKSSPTPTKKPTGAITSPTPTKKATPTQADAATPTPTIPQPTPTQITLSPTPTAIVTVAPTSVIPTGPTAPISPIPSIAPTGDSDVILYALIGAVAITIGAVLLFITGGMSL